LPRITFSTLAAMAAKRSANTGLRPFPASESLLIAVGFFSVVVTLPPPVVGPMSWWAVETPPGILSA